MNALFVIIFCAIFIASSGLQWFSEINFDNGNECSDCEVAFDNVKDDIRRICPDSDALFQAFKVNI
jgi:hypothetical protein